MKKWSLYSHITSHSAYTYDKLNKNKKVEEKLVHFKTSIDTLQLCSKGYTTQKAIDKLMIQVTKDLTEFEKTYNKSKGINKKTKLQIRRDIKLNFKENCLIAFHNSSSDDYRSEGYRVENHIHILVEPPFSRKLGIGYQFIRDALAHVSQKHGLVFHLEEDTGREKSYDKQSSDMTWKSKQLSDNEFIERIQNGWFKKLFKKFQENYFETGNIQFYFKGIRDIEYRCKRLNIDHGLNFNLFLTPEHQSTIKTIYSGDRDAILKLINRRDDKIARAYAESVLFNFSNLVVDELEKKFGQMPRVDIDVNDISLEIKRKQKKKVNVEKYQKTLNFSYQEDLQRAISNSCNEKDISKNMLSLGYIDFMFRAQNIRQKRKGRGKRTRVGFTFKRNNKTSTVYFNEIGTSMSEIRSALVKNSKNTNFTVSQELHSSLKAYVSPQKTYATKVFEEIYDCDLRSSLNLQGFYVKELASSQGVEFKAKGTFIKEDIDLGNRIEIKAQRASDLQRNVRLIADIIEGKSIQKYNISGSETFKLAMKAELTRRENNRSIQVNNVFSNESMNALEKAYSETTEIPKTDEEVLRELSDINLFKINIDENPEEYKKLFVIRANAIQEKDLRKLCRTYELLPTIDNTQIREKIISLGRCLGLSSSKIFEEIGSDLGFTSSEFESFREVITGSENYGQTYLNKFINQLDERLTQELTLDQALSNNQLERNIALLESLLGEMDEFKNSYLNKQEYIQTIENIDVAIASNSFYEAQLLIDGLDDERDKDTYQKELSETINLAAVGRDFKKLKENVEAKINSTASYEIEDDSNHLQSTLN